MYWYRCAIVKRKSVKHAGIADCVHLVSDGNKIVSRRGAVRIGSRR